MNSWVRLWLDMPTDPKWRVIARKSGRPIAEVIAVYVAMLANAGANANERNRTHANASERGVLCGWSDEDAAAAIDTDTDAVAAIRAAMQGKVLDGDRLTGWEKRQPNREDGAAERARTWRERKRTQANASERPDTDTDTDTEKNKKEDAATPLPFASPEFVTAWTGWEKHLREKRIKRTPTARDAQLAKCAGWGEARAVAALRHSTEAGYTGLFEPKGGAVPFRSPAAVLATDEELAKAWGAK